MYFKPYSMTSIYMNNDIPSNNATPLRKMFEVINSFNEFQAIGVD